MASAKAPSIAAALALLVVSVSSPAPAQLVPEGIHSETRGPSDLCGLVGADANAVIALLRTSAGVRAEPSGSDRFELFYAREGMVQWVITRPSEPAHPAVTCRRLSRNEEGSLVSERQMRCDADRLPCDRLFLEFRALDEQLRAELSARRD